METIERKRKAILERIDLVRYCTKPPLSKQHVFTLPRLAQEWRSLESVRAYSKWRRSNCPPLFLCGVEYHCLFVAHRGSRLNHRGTSHPCFNSQLQSPIYFRFRGVEHSEKRSERKREEMWKRKPPFPLSCSKKYHGRTSASLRKLALPLCLEREGEREIWPSDRFPMRVT